MPPLSSFQKTCFAVAVANAVAATPAKGATINVGPGCSLIDAINTANNDVIENACAPVGLLGDDDIVLPAGSLTYSTALLSYGDDSIALPAITSTINIQGHASGSTIERDDSYGVPDFRVLTVGSGGDLSISSVTIQGGAAASNGGGIYVKEGILSLNDSTVSGNTATASGGGISAVDATSVTLENSSIVTDNTASSGGGIDAYQSDLIINQSIISDNTASLSIGGGISVAGEYTGGAPSNTVVIQSSQITGNDAANIANGFGGGMFLTDVGAQIQLSTISNNSAHLGGGGVFSSGYYSTLMLNDSTVSLNSVDLLTGVGGGLALGATITDINNNTTIAQNDANYGGGIALLDSSAGYLEVNNSRVESNTAQTSGGGIANQYYGEITIEGSTFASNTAVNAHGGGVFDQFGDLLINSSTFSNNSAGIHGGGGYHSGATFTLNVSTFSANTAATDTPGVGGALHLTGTTNKIYNSTLYGNTVANDSNAGSFYASLAPLMVNTVIASATNNDCYFPGSFLAVANNWFSDATCSGVAQGTPNLNPLMDNNAGLPGTTLTHAPALSSGLLNGGDMSFCDAIPDAILATDQRGAARVTCDIGAVEGGVSGEFDQETCFAVKVSNGNVVVFCL